MKKWILALFEAVRSGGARADWLYLGTGYLGKAEGNYDHYADLSTIHRVGDKLRMWTLLDFKESRETPWGRCNSYKTHQEFDCSGKRQRSLESVIYAGRMGKGGLVTTRRKLPGEWEEIKSDSVAESQWLVACGKTNLKLQI